MYNLTRQEASEILGISTRSIDRYIKSGKIRAQKEGKIVYVNSEDINFIGGNNIDTKVNIIIPKEVNTSEKSQNINHNTSGEEISNNSTNSGSIVRKNDYDKITGAFEKMFSELRNDLNKKEEKIQELSIEIGKKEEVIKNSVPIVDYKKSQFLLEESKSYLNKEVVDITNDKNRIFDQLKYEKSTNKILIGIVILLIVIIAFIILT